MGEFLKKENEKQVKNIERLVEKAEIKQDIEKNSYKKYKQVNSMTLKERIKNLKDSAEKNKLIIKYYKFHNYFNITEPEKSELKELVDKAIQQSNKVISKRFIDKIKSSEDTVKAVRETAFMAIDLKDQLEEAENDIKEIDEEI